MVALSSLLAFAAIASTDVVEELPKGERCRVWIELTLRDGTTESRTFPVAAESREACEAAAKAQEKKPLPRAAKSRQVSFEWDE